MDGGAPPDDADDGVTIVRLASAASQDVRRPLSAALGAAVLWLCPAFYLAVREDLATFGGPLVRVVMPGAALALLVLGALAARHCLLTLRPRHAIIGADGVCFAGAFDQVFVPFGEVAEVRLEPNGTSLRTRAGGLVLMPVAPASFAPSVPPARIPGWPRETSSTTAFARRAASTRRRGRARRTSGSTETVARSRCGEPICFASPGTPGPTAAAPLRWMTSGR
jgi:hypothetical protein